MQCTCSRVTCCAMATLFIALATSDGETLSMASCSYRCIYPLQCALMSATMLVLGKSARILLAWVSYLCARRYVYSSAVHACMKWRWHRARWTVACLRTCKVSPTQTTSCVDVVVEARNTMKPFDYSLMSRRTKPDFVGLSTTTTRSLKSNRSLFPIRQRFRDDGRLWSLSIVQARSGW